MENTLTLNNDAHENFIFQTMLTCLGNKRKLLTNIVGIIDTIRKRIGKSKLNIVDGFAGSSVVSRALAHMSDHIYTNDLEMYSYLMAKCYMMTPAQVDQARIAQHIQAMNNLAENGPFIEGIICKLYAPKNSADIKEGERCFYTRENALIIDTLRKYISDNVEAKLQTYCLVPLLNRASINANTAGVFKGFYKKGTVGHFGGAGENSLSRILKPIRLDMPVWSDHKFSATCSNKDMNVLIDELPDDIDVIYLDPPYNQHPYGSNYFMLNVIAKNEDPVAISKVSGIPSDWNKSVYNKSSTAYDSMKQLLEKALKKSQYVLISYNNEGIITAEEWRTMLAPYETRKHEFVYDTFKGSRNLADRSDKVMEIVYEVREP